MSPLSEYTPSSPATPDVCPKTKSKKFTTTRPFTPEASPPALRPRKILKPPRPYSPSPTTTKRSATISKCFATAQSSNQKQSQHNGASGSAASAAAKTNESDLESTKAKEAWKASLFPANWANFKSHEEIIARFVPSDDSETIQSGQL